MVRGQGMPSPRHHDFGNLYIQFNVKFPEKGWTADEAAFKALRQYLPTSEVVNTAPDEAMTEPVDLEDVDNSRGGFSGATDDDEAGDHEHAGGERVQCATQ